MWKGIYKFFEKMIKLQENFYNDKQFKENTGISDVKIPYAFIFYGWNVEIELWLCYDSDIIITNKFNRFIVWGEMA